MCVGISAQAEDRVLVESTIARGGLICDSASEVKEFISLVERGTGPQEALGAIAGCGILIHPMVTRVVMIDVHQTTKAQYLIVRYDFLTLPLEPQYGLIAKPKKPSQDT